MRTSQTWRVTLALVLGGFAGTLQNAETHATESNLQFTIQARPYGKIDPRTLAEAEKIAAEIFREAGVQSRWVDEKDAPQSQNDNSANNLDIRLHILPPSMANRFGLPSNVMGVAPGTVPTDKTYMSSTTPSKNLHTGNWKHNRGDLSLSTPV
jgi:hypothetical protein